MIRAEAEGDIAAVRDVNRRAFGQDQEATIVDALRASHAVVLSLVASLDGRIVGHAMFSPAHIGPVGGAALGPMAVLPEHQRRGVGSRLVAEGKRQLQERGCPFIVVVGHAGFYPRFGFERASAHGITCEWNVPDEAFMILVLSGGRGRLPRDVARYRPEFSGAT